MTKVMSFRRALVIRFGGLGDILLATPTVRALYGAYPGVAIDFIVGSGMEQALTGNAHVRRIIAFDKSGKDGRLRRLVPFLASLARERYDLVINLHPNIKSQLMAAASGARCRITFQKRMEVREDTGRVAHAVDDFAKEVLPLGISVTDRRLDFVVPTDAQDRVDSVLLASGVSPDERLLVINPAASRPINRWPRERFRAVAEHFSAQRGMRVVVTGARSGYWTPIDPIDEEELAAYVASADSRIVNTAGQLTVKELGALFLRAGAFLTCDSGPMHVAAALDTPMVVLSGAADPDRTGPLTPNARVLIDRSLGCVPCRDRLCARSDVLCMSNLGIHSAIEALNRAMGADASAAPRLACVP
jgi:ADP-heptose:LPS heptosyltransferase